MREIKLTINGKEVQLTDEQLRMLGIEAENRKNPFDRVAKGEVYISTTRERKQSIHGIGG